MAGKKKYTLDRDKLGLTAVERRTLRFYTEPLQVSTEPLRFNTEPPSYSMVAASLGVSKQRVSEIAAGLIQKGFLHKDSDGKLRPVPHEPPHDA